MSLTRLPYAFVREGFPEGYPVETPYGELLVLPYSDEEMTVVDGGGFEVDRVRFRVESFHATFEHDGWRIDRASFKLAGDATAREKATTALVTEVGDKVEQALRLWSYSNDHRLRAARQTILYNEVVQVADQMEGLEAQLEDKKRRLAAYEADHELEPAEKLLAGAPDAEGPALARLEAAAPAAPAASADEHSLERP